MVARGSVPKFSQAVRLLLSGAQEEGGFVAAAKAGVDYVVRDPRWGSEQEMIRVPKKHHPPAGAPLPLGAPASLLPDNIPLRGRAHLRREYRYQHPSFAALRPAPLMSRVFPRLGRLERGNGYQETSVVAYIRQDANSKRDILLPPC